MVSLSREVRVKGAGDLLQRTPDRFQRDGVVRKGLKALGRLKTEFVIGCDVVQDNHAHELMLLEFERFDRPQDAAFVNSL